jgi:phage tail sheath gpL-like
VKPTRSQIFAALNAGVTPIGVRGARTYLVKRVTTRYKSGALLDYRIRDPHKRLICDRYADALISKAALQMRGKEIGDDPKGNEPAGGPRVVTPRVVKAMIDALTSLFGGNDLLQNVPEIKAQTSVLRDTSNRTRMGARVPLQPIDILDQMAFRVDQIA